jgi:hypothetical protein
MIFTAGFSKELHLSSVALCFIQIQGGSSCICLQFYSSSVQIRVIPSIRVIRDFLATFSIEPKLFTHAYTYDR